MEYSESDTEDTPTTPKKLRLPSLKQKHRAQRYRKEWETCSEYKVWIQPDKCDVFKAHCRYCNTSFTAEVGVLKNHAKSKKHQNNVQGTSSGQTTITNYVRGKGKTTAKQTQIAEIKLSGFFAEHNLAFNAAEHLNDLLKECFPDSEICKQMHLKRKKTTAIITNVIGASYKEELAKILAKTKFSVLTDDSTDVSSVQTGCILVRYFNTVTRKIESKHWELHQVFNTDDPDRVNEGATGKNIFEAIIKSFQKYNVPSENIIGFASDGASVMMGAHNSVASRFREECPGIVILKCVCHSAHLCASEACKELPRRCEDLARNVYATVKNSAKRQAVYQQFQKFLDVKPHKLLHPSQTRWLSLCAVVLRMLEQWEPLKLFFADMWLSERLVAAELTLQYLRDPFVKLFYLFMQWILPKFNHLNAYFQSAKVVVTELHEKLSGLYKEILLAFIDRDYVMQSELTEVDPKNEEKHLRLTSMYLGVGVMAVIANPDVAGKKDLLEDFYKRCKAFLVVAALEIKKRFHFNDPLLINISVLSPQRALSNKTRVSFPSILPLAKCLPRVVPATAVTCLQKLDDQWRSLPMTRLPQDIVSEAQTDVFWGKLSAWENPCGEMEFQELSTFALNALCLPHSNADSERIFSKANLNKTKIRNKLLTRTMNGILLSSECMKSGGGNCVKFNPTNDMVGKMTHNVLYGPQEPSSLEEQDE